MDDADRHIPAGVDIGGPHQDQPKKPAREQSTTLVNHSVCGTTLFYYGEWPQPGDAFNLNKVTLPNGSKPTRGDRIMCSKCKRPVGINELEPMGGFDPRKHVAHHPV